MDNTQSSNNTLDCKPSTEELLQQATGVRWPTPVTPISQPAPAVHQTAAPLGRQTRSCGPTDITSLFSQSSPPDAIQRKPAAVANPTNTFTPITPNTPSQEDIEVASITGSTGLYQHSSGTGSSLPSGSGIQSESSAFSAYLRESRMQPSELYIPDGSGDTLASRANTRYGHLNNGHEASIVKIESFIPYFGLDRYMTNHHNGDVYLWDRKSNNIKPLALQAGTTLCQQMQQRCSPKPLPMHIDWPYKADFSPAAPQDHHVHHQDPLPGPICETHAMGHHKILFGSIQRTWHLKLLFTISPSTHPAWMDQQRAKFLNPIIWEKSQTFKANSFITWQK